MSSSYKYDVFLSHNSQDKPMVKELARKLVAKGLDVWLDAWKLSPGGRWQEELEQGIKDSASLVVLVGKSGLGHWENEEMFAAINAQVNNPKNRVIPVLLPGGQEEVVLDKLFLSQRTWVDFREGLDDAEALHRLVAGIKSQEPGDINLDNGDEPGSIAEQDDADSSVVDRNFLRKEQLEFVNHVDLIRFTLSSKAPPYHLFDAPAGFGKTMILRELQGYFKEKGWKTSCVSLQGRQSLLDVGKAVAEELGLSVKDFSPASLAKSLVNHKGMEFSNKKDKGLVLFFDVQKDWSSAVETIFSIFDTFIPEMESTLRTLSFQEGIYNPFRVIVASRYVRSNWATLPRIKPYFPKLEPLSFFDVFDAAANFLSLDKDNHFDKLNGITAHLMYYTAGHPGCVARVLGMYRDENSVSPTAFFQENEERIIRDAVYPEIDDVRLGIAKDLSRVFDQLSAFRFLDTDILKKYVEEKPYLRADDEFALSDRLRNTYLMDPWAGGHFLKDGITRRLIPLRLINVDGTDYVSFLSCEAHKICEEKLGKIETQMPDKWLIEYYFQFLQQYLGQIQSVDVRNKLREEFFSSVIKEGFDLFISIRDPRRFCQAVVDTLSKDGEFEFTVNYYLRNDTYVDGDDSPYQQFYAQLMSLFA